MKKIKIGAILVITSMLIPTFTANNSANAIGPSPAFKKEERKNTKKEQNEILSQVNKEIKVLEMNVPEALKETNLFKNLNTNYKDKNYPSEKESKEGLNEKQQIELSSFKKPITENSRIELAQAVRYYQFYFSDDNTFIPLKKGSVYSVSVNQEGKVDPRNNLNYFDYTKLINSIKNNPSYSTKERDDKLIEIEKDLENSIKSLYGDITQNADTSSRLKAWGSVKGVNIPFTSKKFSYLQLLAAYEKDVAIQDVLSYYSTLLDSLEEMKKYSISIRQNKTYNVNTKELSEKITNAYQKVQDTLITPVKSIIGENQDGKERLEKANKQNEEEIKRISGGE